eukprot:5000390-Prymnesium_polylepis.2
MLKKRPEPMPHAKALAAARSTKQRVRTASPSVHESPPSATEGLGASCEITDSAVPGVPTGSCRGFGCLPPSPPASPPLCLGEASPSGASPSGRSPRSSGLERTSSHASGEYTARSTPPQSAYVWRQPSRCTSMAT